MPLLRIVTWVGALGRVASLLSSAAVSGSASHLGLSVQCGPQGGLAIWLAVNVA
jgi:hypothetical protein